MQTLTASAVLFDMDGTLVDSDALARKVWGRFGDRFGIDPDEILVAAHGVRIADTVARWLPEGEDAVAVIADLSEFESRSVDGVAAIAGAGEFLASLPQDRIALVTSAGRALARSRMTGVGLTVPPVLVAAEDVERGKPGPDCYLAAASALGVDPNDAVVFEDAEAGIAAALDAGMRVIVVGEHDSAITPALTRIADYRGIRARVGDAVVTLDIP